MADRHESTRVVFVFPKEVYGENRGDTKGFRKKYYGYIDCNIVWAGYPKSKRCGEAYNVSDIMLGELVVSVAEITNQNVVFELPDKIESAGYSRATKMRLDGSGC